MRRVRHRVGQGLRALLAPWSPLEQSLAQQYLSPAELAAFRTMSRTEQLHSLNVLRDVLKQQPESPGALAAAALLHDVGKSRYHLAVWQKTLAVLLAALHPSLARSIGQGESLSALRAPFAVSVHHAKWGAEILRRCGSDADVIWLVRHHQDPLDQWRNHACYEWLKRLQAADQVC